MKNAVDNYANHYFSIPFVAPYANDLDAYIPELWAMESVAILWENMVAAALVHRDFSSLIASFGDVVNTRKPAEFSAKRKVDSDDVTVQDASAVNIPVALDQHFHTSFLIKDGEESKGFKNLRNEYLVPAAGSIARAVDRVILGQYAQFLANNGGHLGLLSSSTGAGYLLDTRKVLNDTKAYVDGRNMVLSSDAETQLLKNDLFVSAERVGDEGTALRNASLGRKFGLQLFMDQNMATVAPGNTKKSGAVNNASGYAAGTTVMTVDSFTGAVGNGEWFTVVGDEVPHQVTAHTETLGNTTEITFTPALKYAVDDNAVVNVYTAGAVNLGAGYAVGWSKEIVVDGFTVAPQVGQFVTFGTTTTKYVIIEVNGTIGITLDRPLVAAIADNATVNLGPPGTYNLAFHRNAIALVSRPLALPASGAGALSAVAEHNGVGMRTVITYNGTKQGHLVTLDLLCGIKMLDVNLGAVMLG